MYKMASDPVATFGPTLTKEQMDQLMSKTKPKPKKPRTAKKKGPLKGPQAAGVKKRKGPKRAPEKYTGEPHIITNNAGQYALIAYNNRARKNKCRRVTRWLNEQSFDGKRDILKRDTPQLLNKRIKDPKRAALTTKSKKTKMRVCKRVVD